MRNNFKTFWHYRELLLRVALREIQVKYKQSFFGMAWAVMQPLAMMLMFTLIFSKFAKVPSDGIPYPIFSYCALLPWTFFATSLNHAIPSLENNRSLIQKIYFPREIFPTASVIAAMVDFAIASIVFLVMMIIYKVYLTMNLFFIIPILFIQIIFTLSITFFASAINVYYRDIRYSLPLLIQLWMFASPVIYPLSIVPGYLKNLYIINPMAGIIDGYGRVILHGAPPNFSSLGLALLVSIVMFFLSYSFFKRFEMAFADVI